MILITGAAGFIGTYLINQLSKIKKKIIAIDINDNCRCSYKKSKNVKFYKIDITNNKHFSKLPKKGITAIIDLACIQPARISEKKYDPIDYIRINVIGRLNVLNFCIQHNIRKYLYTCSHRNTADFWGKKRTIKEKDGEGFKFSGEYAMYSISESAAINCIKHYNQQYNLHGIIFRLPPVYGYGPHTEIFKNGKPIITGFKTFIENATSGKTIEIWGNPNIGRDIIYVKDVCSAIILALRCEKAIGLYNIASGYRLSLNEEVKKIIKHFSPKNSKIQIIFKPEKPNSIDPFCYDISKAKRELKWSPKYSFDTMLLDYKKEMGKKKYDVLLKK